MTVVSLEISGNLLYCIIDYNNFS